MSEMLTRVANALAQRFKDRVAARASTPEKPVTFEETGVTCPSMDVWMDYARAGVEAMLTPTQAMKERGHGAGWHGGIEGLHDAEEEFASYLYVAMIDEALK